MHHFHYKGSELWAEDVPLSRIAKEIGTPCYVYSYATLARHWRVFDEAFAGIPHIICFSVKANSNLAVLRALGKMGAGFDIVSGGELFRCLTAGAPANRIVYSGVGKTEEEMRMALSKGIFQFNVESEEELKVLNRVAKGLGKKAPVSIRVNPDINPKTHPYISTGLKKSKFGVPVKESLSLYRRARRLPFIKIQGIGCHIGSQITRIGPFRDALVRVAKLVEALRHDGFTIDTVDLGGGLGITYRDELPPVPGELGKALSEGLAQLACTALFEPGRVIAGNAGILLTKVLYRKKQGAKNFVIVDGAMNDLIRPALYGSYHQIWPVRKARRRTIRVDVVGPICESGDFFAENRPLPVVESGELLAVMSAGAYGFVMGSNYNARPRVAEVMVHGDEFFTVRNREEYRDLLRGEHVPKFLI